MPLNILTTQTTGKTLFASLERLSDGFFWNVTTSAWANNPAAADRKVTLTEGSGANAGSYTASVSGLGDAADIRARVHDDADAADKTISAAVAYVWGGNEVPKATDASGNALATASSVSTLTGYVDTEVAAIKAKTDNLPASPAAVGSAMTLAADAVNAAALATDAVAEIDAQLTVSHGSGSWNPDGGVIGPGADPVTVRVLIADEPVPDADVWITSDEEGDTIVAGTLQTDSSGLAVFMLDYGSTYYLWAQKDGVNAIRGQEFVASAD